MMKRIFTLIFLALVTYEYQGQISEGGTPRTFLLSSGSPTMQNIEIDGDDPNISVTNYTQVTDGDTSYLDESIIGTVLPVGVDPDNGGTWTTLQDGTQVWQVKITCATAAYLMPVFNDFYLPAGTKLFVYSEDHSQLLGGYTSVNNNAARKLTISPVKSSAIVIEYNKPPSVLEAEALSIEGVGVIGDHLKDIASQLFYNSTEFNESGDCMVNARCQGLDFCNERRSVALIIRVTPNGPIRWCSGGLITNERRDSRPFFATGFHCLDVNQDHTISSQEGAELQNWLFIFNYQGEGCGNPSAEPSLAQSISGAFNINASQSTDFAVIELNNRPPKEYNAFYGGWSNSVNDLTAANVVYHHPSADIKKVTVLGLFGQQQFRWVMMPTVGNVIFGSSGAPVYNDFNRMVGTIVGGSTGVECDDKDVFVSRFDKAWKQGINVVLNPNGTHPSGPFISSMGGDEPCRDFWSFSNASDLHTSANVNFFQAPLTIGTRMFDGAYNAQQTISAQNVTITSNTRVSFEAGGDVRLQANFLAQSGSNFRAFIGDCLKGCNNGFKSLTASPENSSMVIKFPGENDDELIGSTIAALTKDELSISVYPNPSTGKIQVGGDPDGSGSYVVTLHNLLGETLWSRTVEKAREIELSECNGVYVISIEAGKKRTVKKLIINK